jgi:hypothetical protein
MAGWAIFQSARKIIHERSVGHESTDLANMKTLNYGQLWIGIGVVTSAVLAPFTLGASLIPGLLLVGANYGCAGIRYLKGGTHGANVPDSIQWPGNVIVKWIKGGDGLYAGNPTGYS